MEPKMDFILEYEPYFFIKRLSELENQEEVSQTIDGSLGVAYRTFKSLVSTYDHCFAENRMAIYQFSEDLVNLMKDSKTNHTEYFKLPSPSVLINNKIYFEKFNTWITGILVVDNNYMSIDFIREKELKGDNIGLYYFGLKDGDMVHGYIPNSNDMIKNKTCMASKEDFFLALYDFIYSTLNLLNVEHDDLISFTQDNTERNKKRIKRKKPTFPKQIRYLKLGGQTKKYSQAYTEAKKTHSYLTHVTGFFRTYRNERYTNMLGQTQWIFPFVKGIDLPERPDLQLTKVTATESFKENIKNGKN